MENVSDKEKIEYFDWLLENNIELKMNFIKHINMKREMKKTYKDDDLKALRDEIFDVFDDMDTEMFLDDCRGYDIFDVDIQDDLRDILFVEIEKRMDNCMEKNDFYQALFVLFATKKAIDLEPNLIDNFGLLYDYKEFLDDYLLALIEKCTDKIKKEKLSAKKRKKLVSFLIDNSENSDELHIFEIIFDTLINSKEMALFAISKISKFHINMQLQILNLLEENDKYIQVAKEFYKKDNDVAKMLLQKLHESTTYEEYEKIAKECFEKDSNFFISDISEVITFEKSRDFYLKLLEYKVINLHNLDDYIKYKKYLSQEKIDNLLEKIKDDFSYNFRIKIYDHDKRYDKILHLAQNNHNIFLNNTLEIIKSHYPNECLEIVTKRCDNLVNSAERSRGGYANMCILFKTLLEVKSIKDKVNLYIKNSLVNRKPRLPAFLDELGKAGLM